MMKKTLFALSFCVLIAACSSAPQGTAVEGGGEAFGEKFSPENAISMELLEKKIVGKQTLQTTIEGDIDAVCLKKGCWMNLKKSDGEPMRVSFKDYGFFVPTNCAGKKAIVTGTAQYDTTSVADLRHYAEDEGLSEQEIAKITAPEIELVFVADGVIIK